MGMTGMRRFSALLVAGVIVAAVVGACSGSDLSDSPAADSDVAGGRANEAAMPRTAAYGAADTAAVVAQSEEAGSGGSGGGVAGGLPAPEIGPKVIKTADVEIEVARDEIEAAVRDSISTAGRFGGFVISTSLESEGAGTATVVVRVPAESFERALTALEELGEVDGEHITGQDVGQQFVDLEARLRNLQAQETVLLRLMNESRSVSDTIRVQRELGGVQLEIERLTGRLNYLEDQTEMSTISISFVEVGAAPGEAKLGMLQRAWERALDLSLKVVSAVIVGTGFIVPIGLLLAVAYLLLRALRPRLSS
jgi:hypothetical protein